MVARLVLDAMGNFSPIVRQVHRAPRVWPESGSAQGPRIHSACFQASLALAWQACPSRSWVCLANWSAIPNVPCHFLALTLAPSVRAPRPLLAPGQVRWGQKPDGVCLVVGGCARGFPEERNKSSDIIYTDSDLVSIANSPCQLFWEVGTAPVKQMPHWRLDARGRTPFCAWDTAVCQGLLGCRSTGTCAAGAM